ncbi:PAS domain S-box/diguanylate cyclase (GGDEF) domain-containing protein [Mycolicibacterium aurum]|uniref:PAS domain S-box/diguanylate cyclase (GGDEF) domain-containing protein n=1 Tax=Mycolicibacterium aurum TaxID=1791 RepID=A0A448IYR5_MYCAU|nr:GGDEF domain-containing protein [Mycolicibacterium aurum]VEG57646.1 PAS domain S-box/diguanylate cyclase (GGDEF) domain-containing protein [Mycolicibacterium aurum]
MSDSEGVDDRLVGETRRLRVLIDSLPALIGYWDSDCRNVIANAAYVDYFGMTPGQIRGRHIREVLGEQIYALNLPYIERVLRGQEQLFERTLVDQQGTTRYTQASYIPDIVDGEVLGFYAQVTDVTRRVEAERARDDALRLFHISMEHAPIGKVVVDRSGVVLHANPAICRLLRCTQQDLIGVDFRRFVHPDARATGDAQFAALLDGSATHLSSERQYLRADGTSVWLQRDFVLVPDAHGDQDVAVAQFQDITARKEAEAELARLAVTDQLTGLFNRRALVDCVTRHHAATPDIPLGLIFIDLDGFKLVNDTHGHAAGDAVLVAAAQRLAQLIEPPNTAYRLGGDEFVVVAPSAQGSTALPELCRTVVDALSGAYDTDTTPVTLAASVGYACEATDDVDALLRAADAEMYRHKARPR